MPSGTKSKSKSKKLKHNDKTKAQNEDVLTTIADEHVKHRKKSGKNKKSAKLRIPDVEAFLAKENQDVSQPETHSKKEIKGKHKRNASVTESTKRKTSNEKSGKKSDQPTKIPKTTNHSNNASIENDEATARAAIEEAIKSAKQEVPFAGGDEALFSNLKNKLSEQTMKSIEVIYLFISL